MKFSKRAQFYIAKNTMTSVFTKNLYLDYEKWVDFVDKNQEEFTWYEKTKSGLDARANLNKVPIDFRNSVMSSLNKVSCLKEFDEKKGYFNINCSFSSANNWVTIGFERTPKITDLRIFLQMAKHLDALLLYKGTQIIDENILEENKHI